MERSKYAPRIETVQIPTDKIRDLIGKGGATIRSIVEQTGAKIDVDDTGRVSVASSDAEGLKMALAMIGNITAVPEIGKTYLGKVVRIAEFGAFVELFPGTDGLLHISEIAEHRVKEVKDELREGDQVMVKVLAIEGNRIKLSRKALIKEQKAKLAHSAPSENEEEEITAPAAPSPKVASPRHEFDERQPSSNQSTILIEGGDEFDEEGGEEFDEESEPNFNRVDGVPVQAGQSTGGSRPPANSNRRRGGAGQAGQAGLADADPAAASGKAVRSFNENARTSSPGICVCGFVRVAIAGVTRLGVSLLCQWKTCLRSYCRERVRLEGVRRFSRGAASWKHACRRTSGGRPRCKGILHPMRLEGRPQCPRTRQRAPYALQPRRNCRGVEARDSPTRLASSRLVGSSSITENSSPPVRATVSDRRTRPTKTSPTRLSNSSPM